MHEKLLQVKCYSRRCYSLDGSVQRYQASWSLMFFIRARVDYYE